MIRGEEGAKGKIFKKKNQMGDGRETQEGGNMCIPMADSCWGLTENNKIL